MTLKIESFNMGVDKEGFNPRHRFQFSNQEPVNNVLLPDGDDRVKGMYRMCIYNDMIHHPLLKDRATQEIELKQFDPKDGQEPSTVSKQTMLQSNALRFEMYFNLKEETPVAMFKRQMETYISETAIITAISVEDVSRFVNVRFATWRNMVMEIQRNCLACRRNPNSAEIFFVFRIYTQLVEGLLHKQRCNDIRETDKYNVGYMTEAFFAPWLKLRCTKGIDIAVWQDFQHAVQYVTVTRERRIKVQGARAARRITDRNLASTIPRHDTSVWYCSIANKW
jgi:hypothetical protein